MRPATRDSLLRVGLVLAFGLAAALGVMAWQSHERVADLDLELGELESRLVDAAAGSAGDRKADALGERVRDRMAQRHVFSPKPQDRFRQVRGVLGDRVFFAGGESAVVGERFDGVEILRVQAEEVTVLKDGEEIAVAVAGEGGGGGRSGRSRGRRGPRPR